MRTEKEIEQASDRAADMAHNPNPKLSGMTYEQDISDALDWVTEMIDDDPTQPI